MVTWLPTRAAPGEMHGSKVESVVRDPERVLRFALSARRDRSRQCKRQEHVEVCIDALQSTPPKTDVKVHYVPRIEIPVSCPVKVWDWKKVAVAHEVRR